MTGKEARAVYPAASQADRLGAMDGNELFPGAAPDFSDPLGLLRACHSRILNGCEALLRLAEHLGQHGADSEARQAAARIHRYFSTAARHHHQDEEEDVFPLLARQTLKLADLVHALRQEHRSLDTLWNEIEPSLARPAGIEDVTAFRELAERFAAASRAHVEKENTDLLGIAEHILGTDQLKQIGISMAERRGVRPNYY